MKIQNALKYLALLCITIITIIACTKVEKNTNQTVDENQISETKPINLTRGDSTIPIGRILLGKPLLSINKDTIINLLIQENLFDVVDNITIDMAEDKASNKYEAYLTIKGIYAEHSVAYQVDLEKVGNYLYLSYKSEDLDLLKKHTCAGSSCSSCDFTHGGLFGLKITGCACNAGGENAMCNHSITGGGSFWDVVFKIVPFLL